MLRKAYRSYVLTTITLVYTLSFLDSGLIILLLQPIKEDLDLSDTQLGFLTGIAFALFYATLGVPIARWADRGNRATIASLAIGLWGITVMAYVLVTNFAQLVLARVAAAVGESGCMPPTYSLVGDYFPGSAERTRAMAIYLSANPLASLVSFIAGGWLNERYGWRTTFCLMGIPALLVALLVKMTVAEPRYIARRAIVRPAPFPGLAHVLTTLWRKRSWRHLIVGYVALSAMGFGLAPWYAAFMMRSHGMGTGELGVWLGLIFGISGIVGILLGGQVSASWFACNERGQMRLSALMIAAIVPCFVLFLLVPQKHLALIALMLLVLVWGFFVGPTFALMQRLVVDEMRATSMAIVLLFGNLIGMGIGPQIVGALSDLLLPAWGRNSLRYAMLSMSVMALWSAWHFWQVGKSIDEDLRATRQGAPPNPSADQ